MRRARYWVVVPAAGIGQRAQASLPKQYLPLKGKPIIERTLSKFLFHPKIEKIVVVIRAGDYFWPQLQVEAYTDKIITAVGGAQRCHSVYAGLRALEHLAKPHDFILVHDAVRPYISHHDIDKLLNAVGNHPVGGILGSRVCDTLKRSNRDNGIVATLPREDVWQAMTPQMFRYALITQALQWVIQTESAPTDEAAAIEALGLMPVIVEGQRNNIKITHPEDLIFAEQQEY